MNGVVEWAALTAPELRGRLKEPAIGLWALGATEQHGPHLATGFDFVASQTVIRRAAAELGDDVIVLPTLPFGCSDYWLGLGGTLSLAQDTLKEVILDVCRSAAQAGMRRLIIVNGHSGNAGVALAAITALAEPELLVEFVSYWDIIDRERLSLVQDVEDGFGHAGEMETSIGLHLGGLVREEQIPADGLPLDPGAPGGWGIVFHRAPRAERDSRSGVIGDAGAGSVAVGEAVVEMAVQGLVAHCRSALTAAVPGTA